MISLDTITELNRHFKAKTLHPLVSVIYLSDDISFGELKINFYAILLKSHHLKSSTYGWQSCDFTYGALICFAPNTTVDLDAFRSSEGDCLVCFHQDILPSTALGRNIDNYSLFNYSPLEALHLSLREKALLAESIKELLNELNWGVDSYSHPLIVGKIEQLLNYCCRFYCRQSITRKELNKEIKNKTI